MREASPVAGPHPVLLRSPLTRLLLGPQFLIPGFHWGGCGGGGVTDAPTLKPLLLSAEQPVYLFRRHSGRGQSLLKPFAGSPGPGDEAQFPSVVSAPLRSPSYVCPACTAPRPGDLACSLSRWFSPVRLASPLFHCQEAALVSPPECVYNLLSPELIRFIAFSPSEPWESGHHRALSGLSRPHAP